MEHSDVTVMLKGDLCHFPDHNYHGVLKPFINNSWSSRSLEGVWLSGSKGLPVFYSFFPLSARVQRCTEGACVCLSVCLFDFVQWSTARRFTCVFVHMSQLILVIWRSFVLKCSLREIYSWKRPLAQKAELGSFNEKSLVFGHEHDLYEDVSSVLILIKSGSSVDTPHDSLEHRGGCF